MPYQKLDIKTSNKGSGVKKDTKGEDVKMDGGGSWMQKGWDLLQKTTVLGLAGYASEKAKEKIPTVPEVPSAGGIGGIVLAGFGFLMIILLIGRR